MSTEPERILSVDAMLSTGAASPAPSPHRDAPADPSTEPASPAPDTSSPDALSPHDLSPDPPAPDRSTPPPGPGIDVDRPGTFLDREWRRWEARIHLVWGIFNPHGPTVNCVGVRSCVGLDGVEVFHRWLHPTGSETRVLGFMTHEEYESPACREHHLRILERAFGEGGPASLITAIPTFFLSVMGEPGDRTHFELLTRNPVIRQADWGREMDLLARHGEDLFGRAGEEAWRAVRALRAQDPDSEAADQMALLLSGVPDRVGPNPSPLPSAPFTEEAWADWTELMLDTRLAFNALTHISHAWVGSLCLSRGALLYWHPFEALQDCFAAHGLALFGDPDHPLGDRMNSTLLAMELGLPDPPEPPRFETPGLFPLEEAVALLARSGRVPRARVQVARDGVAWKEGEAGAATRVELRARPVDARTPEGLLVLEEAWCVARAPWLGTLADAELDALNALAGVGAVVRTPEGGPALVSRVGIHEGNVREAERIYAPTLASWALVAGWTLDRLRGGGSQVEAEDVPLAGAADPPPVAPHEWRVALETAVEAHGLAGSLASPEGPPALTAEFPWDAGAWTRALRLPGELEGSEELERLAGRTSLLQVRSDHRHPFLGRGIRATLEIPVLADAKGSARLVAELNRWELETPELAPLLGAWVVGPRAPMFLTFIPNALVVPGLVPELAHWSRVRAEGARRWVEGGGVGGWA